MDGQRGNGNCQGLRHPFPALVLIFAVHQVCASKVYTSAEFKREKDNFQSLCKNLERTETKRSLDRFNAQKSVVNEDPNSGCLALKDSYSLDEKNCISLLCLNLSSATQMIPKILMMGAQVAD